MASIDSKLQNHYPQKTCRGLTNPLFHEGADKDRHSLDLKDTNEWKRILRFGIVGASGVAVNMGIFALGTYVLFAHMEEASRNITAGVLGVLVSILTNFLLNDAWTWRDRRKGGRAGLIRRLLMYYVVAGVAGGVQIGVMALLSIQFGLWEQAANLVGIAGGIAINFFVNNLWTFRAEKEEDQTSPARSKSELAKPGSP